MVVPPTHTETDVWRYSLEVWHPHCWALETTRSADVGLLSHGCFSQPTGRTTSLFTLYGDTVDELNRGQSLLEESDVVSDVAEMVRDYRGTLPQPGNATRELLVTTEGATHVSPEFTDRGLIPAGPIDIRDTAEHWTVITQHSRERVRESLDEICDATDGEITVLGVSRARIEERGLLPLDRLSSRQRETFRLAQLGGYYDHPRQMDIGDLAELLDVGTSTAHEHLRKAEAALFHDTDGLSPTE